MECGRIPTQQVAAVGFVGAPRVASLVLGLLLEAEGLRLGLFLALALGVVDVVDALISLDQVVAQRLQGAFRPGHGGQALGRLGWRRRLYVLHILVAQASRGRTWLPTVGLAVGLAVWQGVGTDLGLALVLTGAWIVPRHDARVGGVGVFGQVGVAAPGV